MGLCHIMKCRQSVRLVMLLVMCFLEQVQIFKQFYTIYQIYSTDTCQLLQCQSPSILSFPTTQTNSCRQISSDANTENVKFLNLCKRFKTSDSQKLFGYNLCPKQNIWSDNILGTRMLHFLKMKFYKDFSRRHLGSAIIFQNLRFNNYFHLNDTIFSVGPELPEFSYHHKLSQPSFY